MQRRGILTTRGRELEVDVGNATLHLALMLTPIVDANRQRIGYVLVLDDMTELIRAEKAAAWQEVARRLAHEIKNPLTPIQLSAERIQKRFESLSAMAASGGRTVHIAPPSLDEYQTTLEECVKTILGESTTLKRLINEFSQFARLPQVNAVPYDLHQAIENALSTYDGRLSGVTIRRSFDMTIPLLKIDPEQMKRVFVNLIDNALEAMEQTPHEKLLQIKTELKREHDSAVIEVADSGHGIPREHREDLFLPYFSKRKGGTGLGLAIVRQIITDHRGYIKAEDNKPCGAKIVIELPVGHS
jgi:nitrogen fixation/metabolism regulation signal transduction histidine kinase